jgi:integrase
MRAWEPFLEIDGWKSEYIGVDRALKHYLRKTKSEHTRQSFCDTLMRFLKFGSLSPDEAIDLTRYEASKLVQGYVDSLAGRGLSIRTANTALAYLTVFFRVNGFKGEKELKVERYHQPTRYRKRQEYIPTPEEIYRMAYSSGSKRNRAMVLVQYTSGLRNSTLRAIKVGDVIAELEAGFDSVRILVYSEMKDLVADACKGRIPYYSFISRETIDALRDYLDERKERYGSLLREEPLFCADSPNYDPQLSRKTPVKKRTLTEMVKRAARKASIERWKDVSPHCLRKAFESSLRNNRLDVKDQEFLMGHIMPGRQDAYYDRSKIETLRKKYSNVAFFPERSVPDESQRRKQALLDYAKLQGYGDETLKMLEERLERARTIDEGIEEFRKLRENNVNTNSEYKVAYGEKELLRMLSEGWELVREINDGTKFLLRQ